ncbi:MAG: hydroxymethylglutaryl-CoA reductase, partial [Candidatus Thermoplasmatota archaeon]|nr:hydroxymethylglutaryl-CoA reductase [Candidatus Thermoplasmatota archaeon]
SLSKIEKFPLGRKLYLRFSFLTADAAGQNMANKAAYVLRQYILKEYPGKIESSWLESNFATDKKHSHVNVLSTRGKKVTAEVMIPRKVMVEIMRATPEQFMELARAGFLGSFYSGCNSNGLHAANGLAALFVACGQDAANIAESSTSLIDVSPTKDGLYVALTLPALIVGTVGGGTGLPTQSECLRIMGCKGQGNARKFAEICAATALAGELSLAGAIISEEWTEAHEKMGKNRPKE